MSGNPFEAPYAPGATRGTLVMNAMSGILPVRLIRRENGQLLAQRHFTPVPGDGDPCWVDYDEATSVLYRAWMRHLVQQNTTTCVTMDVVWRRKPTRWLPALVNYCRETGR